MGTETMNLLLHRASCRNFHKRPVEPDVLATILETGVRSASGGNLQPYSIIQIEDPAVRRRLAELCGRQMFIANAPVGLLFCIDWHRIRRWAELSVAPFTATSSFRHFWISFQDTIICAQTICTAADAMGLGSVYIGTVLECFPELREMFALPDGVFPVVLLSLGYPKSQGTPRSKLGTDMIVHRERYRIPTDEQLLETFGAKYADVRLEPTAERLARIEQTCLAVSDREFADRCLDRIRSDGFIGAPNRYFGLHYTADTMAADNVRYLELMKQFGFGWFEEFAGSDGEAE